MSEWKEYKLGDLCQRVTSGGTPNTRKNEYYGGEIPWVRTQEVNFNRIYNAEIKITKQGLENSSAKWIPENSVIIAMYGATAGKVAINKIPVTTNQACCNLIIDESIADYRFIYYNILSRFSSIANMAVGGAQQNLNAGMIKDLNISTPDLPTQTAIAEILSSLDDKIELNNKINQELENLAQTLFKQWFIDFEFPNENGKPYKSSGGEMVESELGEIPKGWEVTEIGLVTKLGAGGDKPSRVSNIQTREYNVPIYSNGISQDGLYGYTDEAKIFEESVTISARGTIGFVCLRTTPFVPIVRLITVIANDKFLSTKFLFMWLKNQNIVGNGTTQQQLTVPDFKGSKILIPQLSYVTAFSEQMDLIIENINLNKKENQQLTNLRDTLLPKLISGELEVSQTQTTA